MMKRDTPKLQTTATGDSRKQRLAEQLRANLQRRKAQTRARRTGKADERPEGIDPANSASDK